MKNKTWGGRFTKPTHPLAEKFNASISFDHILLAYDIWGSKVHAQMLAKQKIITTTDAELINKTLDKIQTEIMAGKHNYDENHEDIHMFIENLLISKIGDVGKKLHTGRSRNDQVALDLRLYLRDMTNKILEKFTALNNIIENFTEQYMHNNLPGYTHLQQAQPITLGQYWQAYQHMLQRDSSRFQDMLKRMNFSPLGAGALAGSNLPLDRNFVAQELGFSGIVVNTIDAVSDRDFVIEFCAAASITMMHLSRLCEDLIIWASAEFDFIELDDAFATGSSLMPNKKNPDILELIRGKSGRVFGHLMAILTLMKGLPLAYNKDMQEDKEALFDTVNTLTSCLEILPVFLQSLKFNTEKMSEKVATGFLEATAVLENLVINGMAFRDAHTQVGQWILKAQENSCSLKDILGVLKHE